MAAAALLAAALSSAPVRAQSPADMPPLTWLRVAGTRLDSVQADPDRYAELQGNGFENVIAAWNGAVLDDRRNRVVVWGGGHNDYYGNELYAFDIASLSWSRLTEPTVDWNACGDPNADGTANGRHTYNGLAYIAHADRFFASGGALNCSSGGCGASPTWTFDFEALAWESRSPSGAHSTGCENTAAYDPTSRLVYWGDTGGLYSYSHDDNRWRQLTSDYLYGATAAVDTTRGQLVMVGDGEVFSYDLREDPPSREVWSTSGDAPSLGGSGTGFDYDPVTDRLVVWSGGPVSVLDPSTRVWTRYDIGGAPVPPTNGMYGRFRYVPVVNAFIAVTATDEDVHFFKLSEGGELPAPFDGGVGRPDGGAVAEDGSASGSDGGRLPDGARPPRVDGGAAGSDEDGCGCATAPRAAPVQLAVLAVTLAGVWRKKRRVANRPAR